jgi:hypothetical protein
MRAVFLSCDEPDGRIVLESGYSLSESDCPPEGRWLFRLAVQLRPVFQGLVSSDPLEQAILIARWLPALWDAMKRNRDPDGVVGYHPALITVRDQLTDIEQAIAALPIVQRRADELTAAALRIPLILPPAESHPPPYD